MGDVEVEIKGEVQEMIRCDASDSDTKTRLNQRGQRFGGQWALNSPSGSMYWIARATVPTAPIEASELLSKGSCVARSGVQSKAKSQRQVSRIARQRVWGITDKAVPSRKQSCNPRSSSWIAEIFMNQQSPTKGERISDSSR